MWWERARHLRQRQTAPEFDTLMFLYKLKLALFPRWKYKKRRFDFRGFMILCCSGAAAKKMQMSVIPQITPGCEEPPQVTSFSWQHLHMWVLLLTKSPLPHSEEIKVPHLQHIIANYLAAYPLGGKLTSSTWMRVCAIWVGGGAAGARQVAVSHPFSVIGQNTLSFFSREPLKCVCTLSIKHAHTQTHTHSWRNQARPTRAWRHSNRDASQL